MHQRALQRFLILLHRSIDSSLHLFCNIVKKQNIGLSELHLVVTTVSCRGISSSSHDCYEGFEFPFFSHELFDLYKDRKKYDTCFRKMLIIVVAISVLCLRFVSPFCFSFLSQGESSLSIHSVIDSTLPNGFISIYLILLLISSLEGVSITMTLCCLGFAPLFASFHHVHFIMYAPWDCLVAILVVIEYERSKRIVFLNAYKDKILALALSQSNETTMQAIADSARIIASTTSLRRINSALTFAKLLEDSVLNSKEALRAALLEKDVSQSNSDSAAKALHDENERERKNTLERTNDDITKALELSKSKIDMVLALASIDHDRTVAKFVFERESALELSVKNATEARRITDCDEAEAHCLSTKKAESALALSILNTRIAFELSENERKIALLETNRDISAALSLSKLNAELAFEVSNQERDVFLAVFAHDTALSTKQSEVRSTGAMCAQNRDVMRSSMSDEEAATKEGNMSQADDSATTKSAPTSSSLELSKTNTDLTPLLESMAIANCEKDYCFEMSVSDAAEEAMRVAEHNAEEAMRVAVYNAEVALLQKNSDIQKISAHNEQFLAEALVAAEVRQMKSIMGCVAHDLKTPLQSFISDLEALKSIVPEDLACGDVVAAQIFQSLEASIKFMLMQINRSQDYMKASSCSALKPVLSTFSLYSAISLAVKCVLSLKTGRSIKFHPMDLGVHDIIIGDEQWISENILCLLSNAVKYSVRGSHVDLRVMLHDHMPTNDEFCIIGTRFGSAVQTSEKYISLSVEDAGVGISADLSANLFQPFNKAQRMAGGTGIGLFSLSKRIEALNGSYGVGGRKDGHQGSVFWFAIPYRQDCIDSSCTEADSKESLEIENHFKIFSGARILVIDDSISILNLISRVLKTKGALVTTCENGALGLEVMKDAVQKGSLDMVLTDVQMPVLDGFELIKRYRDFEQTTFVENSMKDPSRLLVICMSANNDAETKQLALTLGMDGFIDKPFKFKELAKYYEQYKFGEKIEGREVS